MSNTILEYRDTKEYDGVKNIVAALRASARNAMLSANDLPVNFIDLG
jgi:hypothetical protein